MGVCGKGYWIAGEAVAPAPTKFPRVAPTVTPAYCKASDVGFESAKTRKSGYAPACQNKFVRGVCELPRIKCGECPNQAFIPFGDAPTARIVKCAVEGRAATT